MEESDMDALLRFYEPEKVPSLAEVRYEDQLQEFAFEGSFGWF